MADFSGVVEQWTRLRERYPQVDSAVVVELIRSVVAATGGDLKSRQAELQAEVDALSQTLALAKAEVADMYVDEVMAHQIPSASNELDAIVAHTASATDTILDSCEVVDRVAVNLPPDESQLLQDATSRIYEACSFQDVTGQRITKVMTALKTIDARLGNIGYGLTSATSAGTARELREGRSGDALLMNGPALPGQGSDQSEIDRLLARRASSRPADPHRSSGRGGTPPRDRRRWRRFARRSLRWRVSAPGRRDGVTRSRPPERWRGAARGRSGRTARKCRPWHARPAPAAPGRGRAAAPARTAPPACAIVARPLGHDPIEPVFP
jgi:chemotaxis protein CheZ